MNEPAKLKAINDYRKHAECLPELLGIQLLDVGEQTITTSLEVTPNHVRLRKIHLREADRRRLDRAAKQTV